MNLEDRAMELINSLPDEQSDLLSAALLAYTSAKAEAKTNPKTSIIKALDAALKELQKQIDKHDKQAEDAFKTIGQVHKYLLGIGYKVSTKTLYNHYDDGKLTQYGGRYRRKDVELYAENYLKTAEAGSYADRKAQAEIEHKTMRTQLVAIQVAKAQGEVITREEVEKEFAARIATLALDLDLAADTLSAQLVGMSQLQIKKAIREQHVFVLRKYARALESVK